MKKSLDYLMKILDTTVLERRILMGLTKKENWELQTNISIRMILQVCFVFLASLLIVISFNPLKNNRFHALDGLVLLLFFYINYIPRYKVNLTYKKYNSSLDLIFILFSAFQILLFLGFRKIEVDFKTTHTVQMWLETLIYTIVWVTSGITFSIKRNYITFTGWEVAMRRSVVMVIPIFVMALLEEIYFRGFVFNFLNQILGNNLPIAFVLATLIFGIAHLKKRGWTMVFLSTMAGIFYCITYIRTGSIYCATFIHFVTNVGWLVFFNNNAPIQKRI